MNMEVSLQQASEVALSLSLKDRAALAHSLIESLDDVIPDQQGLEEAWDREIKLRIERFESGHTTDHDAFEVIDEIRDKYS